MTLDDQMSQETAQTPHGTEQQTPPQTWQERFKSFLSRGWFNDLDETITRPNFRFNIMGVECVPSGEITAVSGKAGAGKSTALAILVGVLIGRTDFAGIRCVTPCRKVLWIDTEKGEYTCQQKMSVFRRVANIDSSKRLEDVGVNFALMRQETTEDRLLFVDALAQLDNYDAIVIDGIFDLTKDPDKEYSPVTELMRRLADKGASVFAMLHTNKSDDNMRYALGTELQRLATTRLDVEFKGGQHIIRHTKSNDSALAPEVAFVFDEVGNVVPASQSPEVKAEEVAEANREELRNLMVAALGEAETMRSTDIMNRVMQIKNCKERTAKSRISEAKAKGIIKVAPKGSEYVLSGY
ncbi:MAG: AAA family ATPase [Prevotella sp.]|nr:AAA family ATPase [Prevotella sp.]